MVIIPRLEGLVSTVAEGGQAVETWVEMVKTLLRSPLYRDLTDLEFDIVPAVTDVGIPVSASATHLIAACWEISGDLGTDTAAYLGFTDGDTDTIDITVAMSTSEDVVSILPANDLADSTISEFYPIIFLAGSAGIEATAGTYSQTGIGLATGLTAWADGKDGNAVTAASCRVFVLYRT